MKKAGLLNASARDGVAYRTASVWQIVLGMANNGANIGFYLLIGFAQMVATQNFAIASATTGILITLSFFLDAATDALVALVFERVHIKRGKIQIFLIVGWAMTSFGALMLYRWSSVGFSGIGGILLFLLAYNIYRLGYTINGTAGGTVGIVLTNDPTQRPMMSVVGTAFSYCVPLIFTNLTTFVILPKYDNLYNTEMLREMVLWYLAITAIFVVLACAGVHKVDVAETFEAVSGGKQKISFKDMIFILKENRNLQMYIISGVSDKLAQNVSSQSVINTLLAGVLIGSYAASTMVQNFSQIVGIVFAFAGGIFVAKWGAKKATSVWSWASICIAAAMVGFCLLLGGPNGMDKLGKIGFPVILWAVLMLAKNGMMMILTTAGAAMKADIVDYECERSGKYMPAVVSAVYSFIDKIITSFSATIAGIGISLVGYTTTVPQMGDKATWPIFWMAMFLVFGMPILGWICNVIAMHFYSLDRERMIQVQKNLAARKEAEK